MLIDMTTVGEQLLVRLTGRFDFTTRDQFIPQVESALSSTPGSEVKIDMSRLEYIDSSALGMLLMLRDKAKRHSKTVTLIGAHGMVKDIITTAQFDRLFTIH
jgi:anti-anti-sigma factor